MASLIPEVLEESIKISAFVFMMMTAIDLVSVFTKGKLENFLKGRRWRSYLLSSLLGATPGCLGAFTNISLYIHGLYSFGAIVAGMIATSGDEALVMLSLFPQKALLLFVSLFGLGIFFGWVSDLIAKRLRITPCVECQLQEYHPGEVSVTHYLKIHIWDHILKKHLWRVFLWIFFALLFLKAGLQLWNLEAFVKDHLVWVLLLAVLISLIPESGPHLIFVFLFADGVIPFSVLLASSMGQDGHGMLPLLSYAVRDFILIKLFNAGFALIIGLILYGIGL